MRPAVLCLLGLFGCGAERLRTRADEAVREMDLPRAERLYRAALARRPDDPDALYGLGWTYHLSGHPEQANDAFERCLTVAPEHARCLKGLGSVALTGGHIEVARARFEQALARAPGDASIRNSLALLELRVGNVEQSLGIYEDLCARDPDAIGPQIGRAEALLRLERTDEALASVDLALAHPDLGPREEVLALTLRARILLEATSGRLDPTRCEETAPPLFTWLDEAEAVATRAGALGLDYPEATDTLRQVRQRRRSYGKVCPEGGLAPETGK